MHRAMRRAYSALSTPIVERLWQNSNMQSAYDLRPAIRRLSRVNGVPLANTTVSVVAS